jgi:hypothetical protein
MATIPTLTVCCVCKHVVAQGASPPSHWMPMSTYLERHHLRPIDVRLSHTYCPVCYEQQAEAWSIAVKDGSERTTPRAA